MNFMKKSFVRGIRDGIKALGGVEALLLRAFDLFAGPWGPANSSYSPVRSAKRLLQGLYRAQNPKAIIIEI